MPNYTTQDLINKMAVIKNSWHEAIAKGDQGAGRTLEKLLGVPENNLSLPDFGEIEIKSQKFENKTLISLFTKEPQNSTPSASIPLLIKSMGWKHENAGIKYNESEKVASFTISPNEYTNRGMTVTASKDKIYIEFDKSKVKRNDPDRSKQKNYSSLGEWFDDIDKRNDPHFSTVMPLFYNRKEIEDHLIKKLNNTFLCLRINKTINGKTQFKFVEGYILNNILQSKIDTMYKKGLFFDIGARTNHNHGTKLRMKKENLMELFEKVERIF